MKIILVTETVHAGGAETFVIRLANELSANHELILVNLYPHLSKHGLINQLSEKVTLFNLQYPFRLLLSKIDGFLYRCNLDLSFIEFLIKQKLKKLIKDVKPNVVHTHLFKTDYYVSSIRHKINFKFKHVMTNHGDYLLYQHKNPVRMLNYPKKLHKTLASIDKVVVISDEQRTWALAEKEKNNYRYAVSKILNGYPSNILQSDRKLDIHLNDSDFVYGMVARGIKQKGWHNLIKAFNRLEVNNKKLLLVGEGPEIDFLKELYKNEDRIEFTGYTSTPVEYIKRFNVAIFISFAPGESLPTVIIEYLACGKPLIATEVGAVKQMLEVSTNKVAGLLLKYNSQGVDEEDLIRKMYLLYEDHLVRNDLVKLAHQAFLKFDMRRCVESYLGVYAQSNH